MSQQQKKQAKNKIAFTNNWWMANKNEKSHPTTSQRLSKPRANHTHTNWTILYTKNSVTRQTLQQKYINKRPTPSHRLSKPVHINLFLKFVSFTRYHYVLVDTNTPNPNTYRILTTTNNKTWKIVSHNHGSPYHSQTPYHFWLLIDTYVLNQPNPTVSRLWN